jgi:hypothetical protein
MHSSLGSARRSPDGAFAHGAFWLCFLAATLSRQGSPSNPPLGGLTGQPPPEGNGDRKNVRPSFHILIHIHIISRSGRRPPIASHDEAAGRFSSGFWCRIVSP